MQKQIIISLSGFIGSGKNAVADYLIDKYDFKKMSFAASVKDCISTIFSWDREKLEGLTQEQREWRETVDEWWANRLGINNFSPRWALQHFGTETCRNNFHQDIWLASLERKISTVPRVVITDSRFPNEMHSLRKMNAIMVQVSRGDNPEWYTVAEKQNMANELNKLTPEDTMEVKYPNIHYSEWAWIGKKMNYEIHNNGTFLDLQKEVDKMLLKVGYDVTWTPK